jgi:arylsulfatase
MVRKEGIKVKNILILFTDQQRYDTIGAMGNPSAQTPNLDRLVKESVVFDRCITPSPVCVPARLCLFAGQYPARTGCNNNNYENSCDSEGFYARLTKAGYQSICVGKMHHLKDPYGPMGFEKRFTQEELSDPRDDYTQFIEKKYPYIFDYNGMRSEMYYVPQISPLPAEDHPTAWVADRSIECIQNRDKDRPLLLVSSFIHPHPPYCPPAPWNKLFRDDPPEPFIPPEDDFGTFKDMIGWRCSCERLEMSRQDILRTKNFYYACVSFVDYQIGRIIKALKEAGIYDDTLILFASDHGDMMGDYNAIGKRTMVDCSCHVPFILRNPEKNAGHRSDICSLVDAAPTLLSFAGVPYDEGEYDGVDLFSGKRHEYVFSQHGCGKDGVYMITDGTHKLVFQAADQKYYYFDSAPEKRNVYRENDPQIRSFRETLDQYRAEDRNKASESKTYEVYTKTHPHYPGRMDHTARRDEEAARIPEEYRIDI